MARRFTWLLVLPILGASGCAMCCAPYDYHYPYLGGRWVRDNPTCGRVGSIIEPAGTRIEGDVAPDGQMVTAPQATSGAPQPDGMRSVLPRRGGNSYLPTN